MSNFGEEFDSLAELFMSGLAERAKEFDWQLVTLPATDAPRDGLEAVVNSLAGQNGSTATTEAFPKFRRSISFTNAPFTLLVCGMPSEETEATIRAAHWWAALVRAELDAHRRGDLHLFFLCPAGTDQADQWKTRRSRLEADERFCRKFVWLPPPSATLTDVENLLDRTFLSRPWVGETAEPSSLDPLARLIADMGARSNLTETEIRQWVMRLARSDDASAELSHDLAAILAPGLKR